MRDDHPESSSQALERYIAAQLGALSLVVPPDDVEFIARFVEEEGVERAEKVEGMRGMLEGVVEGGELPEPGVDEALGRILDEWERLRAEEAEREAEQDEQGSPTPPPADPLSGLSDKELAKLRTLRYAYLASNEGGDGAEDPHALALALVPDPSRGDAPPRGQAAAEADARRAADERRAMIEAALRLDGRRKKYKKQQEVDLLAPNLNREKVAYKAQMEREGAKRTAQEKRERDKAALDKQRADQAKAKADKQKKAAKQERRA